MRIYPFVKKIFINILIKKISIEERKLKKTLVREVGDTILVFCHN